MFIQTEPTDDPSTLKFLPGRPVLHEEDRTVAIERGQPGPASPFADRLFEIDGVLKVAFGRDYVAVTAGGRDWAELKPEILGAIADHLLEGGEVLASGRPAAGPSAGPAAGGIDRAAMAAAVEEALRMVIDPELGYNIVDIGLIYEVAVDEAGRVLVRMTTTTKGCPATNYLQQGADGAAWSVDGVTEVEVELGYEPPWTPDMMSDEAKDHFGIRR